MTVRRYVPIIQVPYQYTAFLSEVYCINNPKFRLIQGKPQYYVTGLADAVRCTTADSNEWVDAAGLQEQWAKLPDRDDTMDTPLFSKPSFKTINNRAIGKKPAYVC